MIDRRGLIAAGCVLVLGAVASFVAGARRPCGEYLERAQLSAAELERLRFVSDPIEAPSAPAGLFRGIRRFPLETHDHHHRLGDLDIVLEYASHGGRPGPHEIQVELWGACAGGTLTNSFDAMPGWRGRLFHHDELGLDVIRWEVYPPDPAGGWLAFRRVPFEPRHYLFEYGTSIGVFLIGLIVVLAGMLRGNRTMS